MSRRNTKVVIRTPIDTITWATATETLLEWGGQRESRMVCICNVHSLITAEADNEFADILAAADLVTPDGAPVAWMLRMLGEKGQQRIDGPDLMWRSCAAEASSGETPSIFLYGGSVETLALLTQRLASTFPKLTIAGSYSPPFRELSAEEDEAIVELINASGAGIVWVGLGCPKQERWMFAHYRKIRAVMVGVGAAFDYHAGTLKRAPLWMQRTGFEWLFRLASEPRRLWWRYLSTNSRFLVAAAMQLFDHKVQLLGRVMRRKI